MNPTTRANPSRPPQADAPSLRRFSKAKTLSSRLGICPRTIFRWADQGMITRHKVNARVVLFDDAEVDAFLQSTRAG
jgi:hypothetical protein